MTVMDLRLPIGILFTLYGVLLGGYGLVTRGNAEMYAKTQGTNVNLEWGVVLLVFGLVMLYFACRKKTAP